LNISLCQRPSRRRRCCGQRGSPIRDGYSKTYEYRDRTYRRRTYGISSLDLFLTHCLNLTYPIIIVHAMIANVKCLLAFASACSLLLPYALFYSLFVSITPYYSLYFPHGSSSHSLMVPGSSSGSTCGREMWTGDCVLAGFWVIMKYLPYIGLFGRSVESGRWARL
jgi:hypothetical protein